MRAGAPTRIKTAAAIGQTTQGLIGLTPERIFPPEIAAARRRDLKKALAAPGVTTREYRIEGDPEAETATRIWDARYVPLAAGFQRRRSGW